MALTIDRIEEGSVRKTTNGGWQIQRVAYVSGLTGEPSTMLVKSLKQGGMPQEGDKHPAVAQAICVGHYAVGVGGNEATVYISYESPQSPGDDGGSGGTPNFIVTSDTSLRTIQTQMIQPQFISMKGAFGKPVPLRVAWHPDGSASIGKTGTIGPETLTVSFEEPIQQRTFWGIVLGRDLTKFEDSVGRVNHSKWMGHPTGAWRVSRFSSETQDKGRSYAVTASFERRTLGKDWRTFGILRHQDSGKFVPVSEADIASAEGMSYPAHSGAKAFNGIIVAFPYNTAFMDTLYGIR